MPKTGHVGHTQEADPHQEPTLVPLGLRIPISNTMKVNAYYLSHVVFENVLPPDVFISASVGSASIGKSSQGFIGMRGTKINN